jgi:hypothetical protein
MAIDAADQRNHHTSIDRSSVLGERRARGENRIEQTTRMCGLLVSCRAIPVALAAILSISTDDEPASHPPAPPRRNGRRHHRNRAAAAAQLLAEGAEAVRGNATAEREVGPGCQRAKRILLGGGHWAVGERGKRPMGRGGVGELVLRHGMWAWASHTARQ